MVSDIVRQVAGEYADVRGLLGEGVDPHLYKPTRDDAAAMMRADVIFYSGLSLEGKMGQSLKRLESMGRRVAAVTERIESSYLLHPEGTHGHPDPHVWMDVKAWSQAVKVVAEVLSQADPAHASTYQANAEQYRAKLEQLDRYARQAIATIPASSRVLVTAHDAFNYFGRAYGLEVRGIQGLSTESEAGLSDLNSLVSLLVERRIPAVFVESSLSEKNIRALVEGAGARGWTVRVGGSLYSDAMGPAGTYGGTYIGMIDHNVTIIVRALGGQAPPRGMQGKLTHAIP